MDKKFLNVLILGFGFMFLFTSFQTMGNIEKTILDSIKKDDKTFTADGYISLAIIYTAFSICNWLAPSFLSLTGPRTAMLVGGVTYTLFITTFLWPHTWLLYLASVIVGAGASITWTGQGTYLSRSSSVDTISRNSGIFWALLQMSMFFGNLFVYFQFQDSDIKVETRNMVVGVLISVAILGVLFLACLRPVESSFERDSELQTNRSALSSAIAALKSAGELFMTKDMLLLNVTFFYTGLELSFFSGVYGSSISFTQQISSNPKQIVGLAGIAIGLGEVIGGSLFGLLGSKTTRYGRDPIVIVGYIVHVVGFFLIFINLPNSAPFEDTMDIAYLDPPQAWLALFCGFLLGFGDSCFNTQIYSMLGGVFLEKTIGAFALFKFIQSVGAAISFFYSTYFGLRVQLGILLVFSTIGTGCFCLVEWANKRRLLVKKELEADANSDSKVDSDCRVTL